MKKITLLILMSLFSMLGYSQVFSENFDTTAAIPAGWTVTNNGLGAGQQWVYTGVATQVNSAPGAMRVLAQNTGGTQTFEDWLITPAINLAAISNPELRFQAKTSLGNNQNSKIKVMVSTTNTALASFTLVREWHEFYTGDPDPANAIGTANNVYALNTADLTAAAGGQANVYVAFVMENTGLGDNWFLDDVQIVQLCPNVTTPVATPTGQTTAQLSWANPGGVPSFDVEIVALPGTPTGVPTYTAVTSNPFNVTTGLVAGAQYAFYVRSNCGGVTGAWTTATNFTMPINYCTGTHFYDPGGAAANYPNNSNVTTLICPATPGDIVTVSFATFNTQANTDFLRVYDGPNATYPLLATLSGTTVPAPISANIINGGCLTFVFTSNGATNALGWDATVTCAPPPTCPSPSNLLVNGTTDTTATLSWTPGLSETAWEVLVQAPGAGTPTAASTGIPAGTNTNFVVNPPLTPATNYEYWVRAVCSASDKSIWIGPRTFTTTLCNPVNQCNYTFRLTDSWGDGWNGNTMSVRQNGILVATLGPTFTTGTGPINITVPLCHGLPFELYWNAGGSFAGEVGISVINSFNQTIYTKAPGTGAQNTLLYTGMVDCLNAVCMPPTGLTATAMNQTGATLSWTAGGTETAWQVIVLPAGSPAPTAATPGWVPATTNSIVYTTLTAGSYLNQPYFVHQ